MLLSYGSSELKIPGKNLKVRVGCPFERKDLSGDGSGTEFAAAGDKPAKISCSLQLPIAEAAQLTKLVTWARWRDENGDPVSYRISDYLVNAFQIKQVIFEGDFTSEEDSELRAINVAFGLREVKSVAEKKEADIKKELAKIEQE
ncbi:MAG: hypothetical protein AB7F40_05650 [Victivallaceae bacterium]|nr:hypothetical protein [Victivallaceae bacterium]